MEPKKKRFRQVKANNTELKLINLQQKKTNSIQKHTRKCVSIKMHKLRKLGTYNCA